MGKDIHCTGISGSLRRESFTTHLLNRQVTLLPAAVATEIILIADLPLYNADLDIAASKERPAAVTALKNKLATADGLMIVPPEYNCSMPGGLKNAIDWTSRGEDSPLSEKPVSVLGTATGFHMLCQF